MTGGQMAPTTLEGQVTTTSPLGRNHELQGYPLKMSEILSQIDGAVFVERVSMHDVKHILKAKRAIKKAFKVQMAGLGYSIVEVLSTCPTNWRLTPVEAAKWVEDNMMEYYKLGNYSEARKYLELSNKVASDIDSKGEIAVNNATLGMIYLAIGDTSKALKNLEDALKIFIEISFFFIVIRIIDHFNKLLKENLFFER